MSCVHKHPCLHYTTGPMYLQISFLQTYKQNIKQKRSESDLLTCEALKQLQRKPFIAQLVEHQTGITEVMGSNPVAKASDFFLGFLCNCLSCFTTANLYLQFMYMIYIICNSSLNRNYKLKLHLIYFTTLPAKNSQLHRLLCDFNKVPHDTTLVSNSIQSSPRYGMFDSVAVVV